MPIEIIDTAGRKKPKLLPIEIIDTSHNSVVTLYPKLKMYYRSFSLVPFADCFAQYHFHHCKKGEKMERPLDYFLDTLSWTKRNV